MKIDIIHRTGKKGYLSAQVNPQLYRSTEQMVAQGLALNKAGGPESNVMIKAPALPAGLCLDSLLIFSFLVLLDTSKLFCIVFFLFPEVKSKMKMYLLKHTNITITMI